MLIYFVHTALEKFSLTIHCVHGTSTPKSRPSDFLDLVG